MTKPPQPGYLYIDSTELKQRVALHEKTGWVFCQDKYPDGKLVSYSPKEIAIINESGGILSLEVHNVKMVFTGEIVKYDGRQGSSDSGKQEAGSGADGPHNISDSGEKIPGASGDDSIVRQGELDIY